MLKHMFFTAFLVIFEALGHKGLGGFGWDIVWLLSFSFLVAANPSVFHGFTRIC